MERKDVRIGDIVSVPKGVSGISDGFKGTVVGIYPNFILIKPDKLPYKVTLMNFDVSKITLMMHKINDKTEREFEDILNELG